jgi:hypothetical protein
VAEEDDVMRGKLPSGGPLQPGPQSSMSQGRYVPPPFVWEQLSPEQQREFDRRKKNRSMVTAVILGALVILIFALAIAKIKIGWAH